jgi:hypothetical protein
MSSAQDGSSVVGFMPRPLYCCPRILFDKRISELQRQCGHCPEERNLSLLLGIKLRFHGRLTYSLSNPTFHILTKSIDYEFNPNPLGSIEPFRPTTGTSPLWPHFMHFVQNRTEVRAYLKQICYYRMKPLLSSFITYKHVVGRLAQWYQLLGGRRRASRRVRQVQ